MKTITRTSTVLSVLCAIQFTVSTAPAQSDINFAAPNVLLMVDTSGSMEYVATSVADNNSQVMLPICDSPTAAMRTDGKDKSRWINLVEVLGGTIPNYHCQSISRTATVTGTPFDEFSLGSNKPADFGYPIVYHRPINGTCVRGPGGYPPLSSPTNPFAIDISSFPVGKTTSFVDHLYGNTGSPCVNSSGSTVTFTQNSDGIISSFEGHVRFGLMTFDTTTDPSTGYTGTGEYINSSADVAGGIKGTWSYFLGSYATGRPAGCQSDPAAFEVGARNPAAPPWEGRMVAFGAPDPTSSDSPTTRAEWIRNILLTTRPFGATPIAGMLDDARTFLISDNRKDPIFGSASIDSASNDFGPWRDPYVVGGCRKSYVVLLTDGEPNLDLRPDCANVNPQYPGKCPYTQTPTQTVTDLYVNHNVETFVVGFAVSQVTLDSGTPQDCRNLNVTNIDSICSNNTNSNLQICCTLDRIALAGSGNAEHAYFADSPGELRAALSTIFSKVSTGTTSRTWPVVASASFASASGNGAVGYRFYTSFVPTPSLGKFGSLWSGVIERQRYICPSGATTATPDTVNSTAGDEFADNVNKTNGGAFPRHFYSVQAAADGVTGAVNSVAFIRPYLAADDGAGTYSGAQVNGDVSGFPSTINAAAMIIDNSTCAQDYPPSTPNPPTVLAADCAKRRLNWLIGGPVDSTGYSRCSTTSSGCSLIADVLHSTPAVVNRPSNAPRDQTYQTFATTWSERPLMLYTSTNDGMLHAFKVASNYNTAIHADSLPVTTLANNELWAFIPPAVLPKINSEWPGSHQELLDGAPVVADVVATPASGATYEDGSPRYLFERTAASFDAATASTTGSSATSWRTVLVQGLNQLQGGYFAVDITNPEVTSVAYPARSTGPGPHFLWQLTEQDATRWLFGPKSGTPAITTLFFQPSSNAEAREIAVAILPGGYADPDDGVTTVTRIVPSPSTVDPNFRPRTLVPKYTSVAGKAARSLTIVRLDTGEIVRTFRDFANNDPTRLPPAFPVAMRGKVINTPLDSPITGQPVAYPALVGVVADRAYVGDRDGALWRLNLASSDPSQWSMSMYFDAYSTLLGDSNAAFEGQPIITQPQLSIDNYGNTTVAFATGNQDIFSAANTNFVWSLVENINWATTPVSYVSAAKWYYKFVNGEVPVGPLQLFGSGLYFATYQPAQGTTACQSGSSRIWGMHYQTLDPTATRSDGNQALSKGGLAWLPQNGDPNSTGKVQFLAADLSCSNNTAGSNNTDCNLAGASVFGVSVTQVPSCFATSASAEAFFGTATHTALPNTTSGQIQLVMQTGRLGTSSGTSTTNVTTIPLASQSNNPRISSWASIME